MCSGASEAQNEHGRHWQRHWHKYSHNRDLDINIANFLRQALILKNDFGTSWVLKGRIGKYNEIWCTFATASHLTQSYTETQKSQVSADTVLFCLFSYCNVSTDTLILFHFDIIIVSPWILADILFWHYVTIDLHWHFILSLQHGFYRFLLHYFVLTLKCHHHGLAVALCRELYEEVCGPWNRWAKWHHAEHLINLKVFLISTNLYST